MLHPSQNPRDTSSISSAALNTSVIRYMGLNLERYASHHFCQSSLFGDILSRQESGS